MANKRERRIPFTIQDVKEIRDRMTDLVKEFDGFVQAAEKLGDVTLYVDGGNAVHDAEREFIAWTYKIRSAVDQEKVPKERKAAPAVPSRRTRRK